MATSLETSQQIYSDCSIVTFLNVSKKKKKSRCRPFVSIAMFFGFLVMFYKRHLNPNFLQCLCKNSFLFYFVMCLNFPAILHLLYAQGTTARSMPQSRGQLEDNSLPPYVQGRFKSSLCIPGSYDICRVPLTQCN